MLSYKYNYETLSLVAASNKQMVVELVSCQALRLPFVLHNEVIYFVNDGNSGT